MKWKFWEHDASDVADPGGAKPKLPGPRELPQAVGQHLITREKMDPDQVWTFKCVQRPVEGSKHRYDIRVYNPAKSNYAGVRVTNYLSLNDHPELILFYGWYDKSSNAFEIHKGEMPVAA
jgi:hypothetical protein